MVPATVCRPLRPVIPCYTTGTAKCLSQGPCKTKPPNQVLSASANNGSASFCCLYCSSMNSSPCAVLCTGPFTVAEVLCPCSSKQLQYLHCQAGPSTWACWCPAQCWTSKSYFCSIQPLFHLALRLPEVQHPSEAGMVNFHLAPRTNHSNSMLSASMAHSRSPILCSLASSRI